MDARDYEDNALGMIERLADSCAALGPEVLDLFLGSLAAELQDTLLRFPDSTEPQAGQEVWHRAITQARRLAVEQIENR